MARTMYTAGPYNLHGLPPFLTVQCQRYNTKFELVSIRMMTHTFYLKTRLGLGQAPTSRLLFLKQASDSVQAITVNETSAIGIPN